MPGFKGLAVPGPTNMPFEIRQAMDVALEDHRAPDFPDFIKPLLADLKKVFRTETGQVFIFPGSGTGGWESAIANTLSPGDKVLTSVFGQFSYLWVDMCQRFGLDVNAIEQDWGKGAPLEVYRKHLEADKEHKIKAVLICHNETATGVTSDVAGLRAVLDDLGHPALLFMDGVSSIGSIDFRMDEWGVDVAVSGSQKGFMLPTGLAIVGVSQKLRASMDLIFDEGLDNIFARHNRMASAVRAGVTAWGMETCAQGPEWQSDTVTAIMVPNGVDANDVINTAYYKYDLSLGAGLSKVAGKVFRIGHLGWVNELMILSALGGAELAMRDVGISFQSGAGVGAAVDYFAQTKSQVQMAAE